LPLLLLISLGAEEVEEDEAGTRVTSRGKNVQQIAIGGQPRGFSRSLNQLDSSMSSPTGSYVSDSRLCSQSIQSPNIGS